MSNTALSGAPTGNSAVTTSGETRYEWNFTVDHDGQIGIVTVWGLSDDPSLEGTYVDQLNDNPGVLDDAVDRSFGGVAELDGPDDRGDDGAFADGPADEGDGLGDDGDDGDDGAIASGEGGGFGDSV